MNNDMIKELIIQMSELEQLKNRINESGLEGIETKHIRDDYDPAGDMMIDSLIRSGEYVLRIITSYINENTDEYKWKIFKEGNEPY